MRIAYLILAHDQPILFGRLVRAIAAENVTVYAHIDAKVDDQEFRSVTDDVTVQFVADPVKVNWGGYSQVAAMLKLLQHAARSNSHDYYIFLSGRDYPLRSHSDLQEKLRAYPGRSYMNFYALAEGTDFIAKVRNYCYYDTYAKIPTRFLKRAANRIVREISARLPDRRFPDGLQPYRGSTSWCISADVSKYIIDFVSDSKNSNFVNFFKSVSCCDEIFFQTIVLNSPHASELNFFDVDGKRRPGELKNENKASLHYIDWDPMREDPAILDDRDYDQLYKSDKYFARKFDSVRSASLLDRIDSRRSLTGHSTSDGSPRRAEA